MLFNYLINIFYATYEVWSKIIVILNFCKNCLFIKNYLLPFTVNPLRYNTLMPAFFSILERLLKRTFWYRQQLLFQFLFYLLNRSKTLSFHRSLQFWEEEKSQRGPSLVNTVLEPWLWLYFWPKTYTQASKWEMVRYYGAKFTIDFSIILCVSEELHHTIGLELQNSIPFWPCNLVARIHDASRHCNRRKQWAKSSHLTELDVFFRFWLFWTLPLGWSNFGFNVIVIQPWFNTSYDLVEQIWIAVELR